MFDFAQVLDRDPVAAARLYDEATTEASDRHWPYWQGMARRFAATNAIMNLGMSASAQALIESACAALASYGATTSIAAIARHYSFPSPLPLATERRPSTTPLTALHAQLDAATVLQLSGLLSKQIVLEKLLDQVMGVITANTSAEFACLALENVREGGDVPLLEVVAYRFAKGSGELADTPVALATLERNTGIAPCPLFFLPNFLLKVRSFVTFTSSVKLFVSITPLMIRDIARLQVSFSIHCTSNRCFASLLSRHTSVVCYIWRIVAPLRRSRALKL